MMSMLIVRRDRYNDLYQQVNVNLKIVLNMLDGHPSCEFYNADIGNLGGEMNKVIKEHPESAQLVIVCEELRVSMLNLQRFYDDEKRCANTFNPDTWWYKYIMSNRPIDWQIYSEIIRISPELTQDECKAYDIEDMSSNMVKCIDSATSPTKRFKLLKGFKSLPSSENTQADNTKNDKARKKATNAPVNHVPPAVELKSVANRPGKPKGEECDGSPNGDSAHIKAWGQKWYSQWLARLECPYVEDASFQAGDGPVDAFRWAATVSVVSSEWDEVSMGGTQMREPRPQTCPEVNTEARCDTHELQHTHHPDAATAQPTEANSGKSNSRTVIIQGNFKQGDLEDLCNILDMSV